MASQKVTLRPVIDIGFSCSALIGVKRRAVQEAALTPMCCFAEGQCNMSHDSCFLQLFYFQSS